MGRGALVFKGETAKKKTKSVKSHRPTKPELLPVAPVEQANTTTNTTSAEPPAPPQLIPGTGTVVVSGTVVTGGPFPNDLQVGDAILIQDELRVVTLKVSNQCLNLSSALKEITNGAQGVPYSYICKPRPAASQQTNLSNEATVPVATTSSQLYRERTEHGNYRLKPVPLDVVRDRSDALAWRSKKTSDKYC